MKKSKKKSNLNITKISVIVLIASGVLASIVYCTNIYDWFVGNTSQKIVSNSPITRVQNGTNNVQNISINESKENNRTTTNTKSGQKLKLSFRRFDTVSINQSYIGKDGKKYTTHYSQRPIKRSPHELLYFLGFMLILIFGAGYFLYKMEKLDHDKK